LTVTLLVSNVIGMSRPVDPRTRPALLGAARDLFYQRGISATTLDEIVDEAGLTKPTLYRHFPSKEALVASYLDERNDALDAELRRWLVERAPADRPRAVIDWVCDRVGRPGFRGCAFVRSLAEAPEEAGIPDRARERKRRLLRVITDACRDAGSADPEDVGRQLALIVEGVTTMAFVTGDVVAASNAARRAGTAVLAAAGLAEHGP
jgi:AcrR family transcriptional regulator